MVKLNCPECRKVPTSDDVEIEVYLRRHLSYFNIDQLLQTNREYQEYLQKRKCRNSVSLWSDLQESFSILNKATSKTIDLLLDSYRIQEEQLQRYHQRYEKLLLNFSVEVALSLLTKLSNFAPERPFVSLPVSVGKVIGYAQERVRGERLPDFPHQLSDLVDVQGRLIALFLNSQHQVTICKLVDEIWLDLQIPEELSSIKIQRLLAVENLLALICSDSTYFIDLEGNLMYILPLKINYVGIYKNCFIICYRRSGIFYLESRNFLQTLLWSTVINIVPRNSTFEVYEDFVLIDKYCYSLTDGHSIERDQPYQIQMLKTEVIVYLSDAKITCIETMEPNCILTSQGELINFNFRSTQIKRFSLLENVSRRPLAKIKFDVQL
jgi:hypothetical protein